MKTRILLFSTVIALFSHNVKGQGDIGEFLSSGVDNTKSLIEAYISPWTNAIGTSLSGGWYNSAKPHQLGGFDLTFTANASFIPVEDKTFDLAEIGLQGVNFPGQTITPTIAGSDEGGAAMEVGGVTFTAPPGTDLAIMGAPMVQIGVGLIKETELDVRFFPRVNLGDYGSLGLWGLGVKHSVKQWIPVISKVPVLQLSVQGGFTKLSYKYSDLSITPDLYGSGNFTGGTGDYDNQELSFSVKSFTANILVGASLPVVDFYGGIGIASTKTNIDLTGNFPIPDMDASTVSDMEDPISLEFGYGDGKNVKPRFNVGMRLKFAVITLHGDYTYANYGAVTAGIGISFR